MCRSNEVRYIGTIILSVTNCELPELCHYTYLTATGLPVSASHSFSLGVHAGRVTPVYSTRVGTGIGRYLPALVEGVGDWDERSPILALFSRVGACMDCTPALVVGYRATRHFLFSRIRAKRPSTQVKKRLE